MRFVETSQVYGHPWHTLTFANWRKYPNEFAPHVASVDVISRQLTSDGKLVTDRLLQLKQPLPSFIIKLGVPETSFFLERSTLDPVTQAYQATTYSLNMRSLFQAEEVCCFDSDPETGGTVFSQKATFTAFSLFSSAIEQFAINRFEANAAKGRQGLESVLQIVISEAKGLESKWQEGVQGVKHGLEELKDTMVHLEHDIVQESKDIMVGLGKSDTLKDMHHSCDGSWYASYHHNPFC
ncbi:PRELI-like family-domain-containing protein [Globomyces pollinis-pini]|nr:PRELI-like family-domain-containing protein [Globomyces pollinis-pini]KAJ2995521.1 hypothetical protein HDV02_000693 [Globomyces sp. JEL0801]